MKKLDNCTYQTRTFSTHMKLTHSLMRKSSPRIPFSFETSIPPTDEWSYPPEMLMSDLQGRALEIISIVSFFHQSPKPIDIFDYEVGRFATIWILFVKFFECFFVCREGSRKIQPFFLYIT